MQSKQKWNFRDQITLNILHPRPRKAFVQKPEFTEWSIVLFTWYAKT